MTSTFKQMVQVFQSLGDVTEENLLFKNGKPSKFKGKITSKVGNEIVNLGILHYNWKRSIGVDKINQAIQHTKRAGLDGALMVGSKFSRSAIEQAFRINEATDKRILLIDTQEIEAAYNNFTEI